MKEQILFYGHTGEYGCFSNFYPAVFTYKDEVFSCSEQAYMYEKSLDEYYRKKMLSLTNPYDMKKLGRKANLRNGWDDLKYNIMYEVVFCKFDQNQELKEQLLYTGHKNLHEDCKDPWWGGGPNFPMGRDWLGKILCKVRSKL